jgi:sec-independent protein translocase protein TatB
VFNLQGSELIIILLLALVVLGPEKLPEAMRKLGQFYAELKKMSSGFQQEFRNATDEPMREIRETANLMRDSVDFRKLSSGEREEKPKSAEMAATPATPTPMHKTVAAPDPQAVPTDDLPTDDQPTDDLATDDLATDDLTTDDATLSPPAPQGGDPESDTINPPRTIDPVDVAPETLPPEAVRPEAVPRDAVPRDAVPPEAQNEGT